MEPQGDLYSALQSREFGDELLVAILRRKRLAGRTRRTRGAHTRAFRALWGKDRPALEPTLSRADQDNTTVFFYGDRFALKTLPQDRRRPASRTGNRRAA